MFRTDQDGAVTVDFDTGHPATPTTYREGALDPLRKGHMPAFADELPAADIDLLARWTRAHARGRSLR